MGSNICFLYATFQYADEHKLGSKLGWFRFSYMQTFLEDDHDAWTLSQCQPNEMHRVYNIPIRTATAFLEDIVRSAVTQGIVKAPTMRASHRAVAIHVAHAVSMFLQVSLVSMDWDVFGQTRYVHSGTMQKSLQISNSKRVERMKATGELKRRIEYAQSVYKWARRTCRREGGTSPRPSDASSYARI